MKDGVSKRMHLITTVLAFVALATLNAVIARFDYTALLTDGHLTVAKLKHEVQALVVGAIVPDEVIYGVVFELHAFSVL